MENVQTRPFKRQIQSYTIASIYYWGATILTLAVVFWFARSAAWEVKLPLGVIALLMPVGWFNNYEQYTQLRGTHSLNSQDLESERLNALVVQGLTRQLGGTASVLMLMLSALHAALKH